MTDSTLILVLFLMLAILSMRDYPKVCVNLLHGVE